MVCWKWCAAKWSVAIRLYDTAFPSYAMCNICTLDCIMHILLYNSMSFRHVLHLYRGEEKPVKNLASLVEKLVQ